MNIQRETSDLSVSSEGDTCILIDAKVPVADRLKRYVTKTRTYSYFGPFPVQEVAIKAVRRDEEGVGLYDIDVQCRGGFSWTITLRYAQLYESFKWQVKYDKDLRLPLTHQFPPKDRFSYKPLDDDALEARREGLEKWLNGRIDLVHSYESEPELMKNIQKEMSYILKVGEYGPSLHGNGRTSSVESTDVKVEGLFSLYDRDSSMVLENIESVCSAQMDDSINNNTMTCIGSGGKPKKLIRSHRSSVKKTPIIYEDHELEGAKGDSDGIRIKVEQDTLNSRPGQHNHPLKLATKGADSINPASSCLFTQCRSIWTPKNWVYLFVACIVCVFWAGDVHVVYTVLFVCVGLECCRHIEDQMLFPDNSDIRADRQYSLSGMVRWIFIGLIVLCYLALHTLSFIIVRLPIENINSIE